MLILQNVNLPLDTDFSNLKPVAASVLHIREAQIRTVSLFRKSVDARRQTPRFCCSLLVKTTAPETNLLKTCKQAALFTETPWTVPAVPAPPPVRPVIAGFGPAGMFAALTLAMAGVPPLVLERGADADTRASDVRRFLEGGKLDPESNIQFGEGGAGMFSDGKLNSGIKNPRCRTVLERLVQFGAPPEILIDAKPHVGTDILTDVIKQIRKEIERLGGEIRFHTRLDQLFFRDGVLVSLAAAGEEIPCENLILATGHSARDTFSMLRETGFSLVRKPFSVGVRIEHLQQEIDRALYGDFAGHPALPAADYKLAAHLENGRGVYTFCMCPGGEVINASSEEGGIAVNGMSLHARAGKNANSAVLAEVTPHDLPGEDPLAGCLFQREIEQAAYRAAGGAVPISTVGCFVFGRPFHLDRVVPTVRPAFRETALETLFPSFVTESLREGICLFDKKIAGFAAPDAVLTAPETRSSSPVRVLRDETGQSPGKAGIFPCGEGAGYAGGILSAAVDGMKAAEAVLTRISRG